jgi:hypothetical protein
VQCSRAQCSINIVSRTRLQQVQECFLRWLPPHAGLVSDLHLHVPNGDRDAATFRALELALQQCAQQTSGTSALPAAAATAAAAAGRRITRSTSAAAAAAAAAARGSLQNVAAAGSPVQNAAPLPLRLRSFEVNAMPRPQPSACCSQLACSSWRSTLRSKT